MHTVDSFYVLSKKHVNIQQVLDDLLSTWQQGHQSQDIIGAGRKGGGGRVYGGEEEARGRPLFGPKKRRR